MQNLNLKNTGPYCLSGDLGGTKIGLALYEAQGPRNEGGEDSQILKLHARERFQLKNFNSLSEIIDLFIKKYCDGLENLNGLSLGVAGPVKGRKAVLTNLNWSIDADQLEKQHNLRQVLLSNDLEAHGYGVLYSLCHRLTEMGEVLSPQGESMLVFAEKAPQDSLSQRCLLAVGTGLGECILLGDGPSAKVLSSEGGHSSFAPFDEREVRLLAFAWKTGLSHVSQERLISGLYGFQLLYSYLVCEEGYAPLIGLPEAVENQSSTNTFDYGFELQKAAEAGHQTADEVFKLFTLLLAGEAGNLALKSLARGGVFIGGGVANKLRPWIKRKEFSERFFAKGRFEPLLQKIPLCLLNCDDNALVGLAWHSFNEVIKGTLD